MLIRSIGACTTGVLFAVKFVKKEPPIMLLTIQFPIADARPFLKNGGSRLPAVDFSVPHAKNPKNSFVRYFGKIKQRTTFSAPLNWASDVRYASAKAALTMPDLGQYYQWHQKNKPDDPPIFLLKPSSVSRRLFFDSQCLGRVEVQLRAESLIDLDGKQCLSVIKDYLTLPTKVPSLTQRDSYVNASLMCQGSKLAELFLHATSPTNCFYDKHTVMGCNPVLFFEYHENAKSAFGKTLNKSILPEKALKLDTKVTNGVSLAYFVFDTVPVWFIGCNADNMTQVKSLKHCLLRLHAEQETLNRILGFFSQMTDQELSKAIHTDELGTYLSTSSKSIFKNRHYGVLKKSILSILKENGLTVNAAILTEIMNKLCVLEDRLSKIADIRQNSFLNLLKELIKKMLPNVNVVDANIRKSRRNATTAPIDLRVKLENVINSIEELCKELPLEKQESISHLLEVFTRDATEKDITKGKPDAQTLQRIKDTAAAVINIAGATSTVIAAVSAVLKLFQ